jgi:DMSO reductase anchor subunit
MVVGRSRGGDRGEDSAAIAALQTKLSSGHVSHGAFACVCVCVCVGMSGQIYETRWEEIEWTQHCCPADYCTTYLVCGVVLVCDVCECVCLVTYRRNQM